MTTGVYTTLRDYHLAITAQHGETQPVILLGGGDYAITVHAGTWNSGSLDFQIMLPDGATYATVLPAAFAADGIKLLTGIPPGQYKFVITTTDNLYFTLVRVRRGAGA